MNLLFLAIIFMLAIRPFAIMSGLFASILIDGLTFLSLLTLLLYYLKLVNLRQHDVIVFFITAVIALTIPVKFFIFGHLPFAYIYKVLSAALILSSLLVLQYMDDEFYTRLAKTIKRFYFVLFVLVISYSLFKIFHGYSLGPHGRLSIANAPITTVAEIGFAGYLIGLYKFDRDKVVSLFLILSGTYVVYLADSRGGLVAILVSIIPIIYRYIHYLLVKKRHIYVLFLLPFFIFILLQFDGYWLLSKVLHFDDASRGINAGFTGRLERMEMGIEYVILHPFIGGYGFGSYNLFISLASLFGLPLVILLALLYFYSIYKLWVKDDYILSAILLAALIYGMSASRTISADIFPFILYFFYFLSLSQPYSKMNKAA